METVDKRPAAVRHGKVQVSGSPGSRGHHGSPGSPGTTPGEKPRRRILVVGGGQVGTHTALHLQRGLRREVARGEVEIVVLTPDPYMTYQPFLPEAAAGSISPRHAVVPLRRVLHRCRIVVGTVRSVDHAARTATLTPPSTARTAPGPETLRYDELVLVPDAVPGTLPVPGLAEHGIRLTTVEEAVALRNHVVAQLDLASSTRDPDLRAAALTFVVVGGRYTSVAALGELEDMTRYATRHHPTVWPEDLTWILVEASDRVLAEAGPELGAYAVRELRRRNVDVRLRTRLDSCTDRVAVLDDGSRVNTRTVVWTASGRPHPVLAATGLPRDEHGRLICTARLTVDGVPHAWAAGDAAAVPDTAAGTGAFDARHAVGQARVLAGNLVAALRGTPLTEYAPARTAAVAPLGLHRGVAQVRGRYLKGYPAWFMHRLHHLSRVPTVQRRARVLAEWAVSGLFAREVTSLGSPAHPGADPASTAQGPCPRRPNGSI